MRVIAGEFRSRRLKAPPGNETRPTPDRLREALFSILAPILEGAIFVDAYAGGGSVGIEALSRGAGRVIFLEKNRGAAAIIRENLASLGAAERAEVRCVRAAPALQALDADIVFLDPPYPLQEEYRLALEATSLNAGGVAIAQHASKHELAEQYGSLRQYRVLRQGDNSLSFYKKRV